MGLDHLWKQPLPLISCLRARETEKPVPLRVTVSEPWSLKELLVLNSDCLGAVKQAGPPTLGSAVGSTGYYYLFVQEKQRPLSSAAF